MTYKHDPEGRRLPIKIASSINGEVATRPLNERDLKIIDVAQQQETQNARARAEGRPSR